MRRLCLSVDRFSRDDRGAITPLMLVLFVGLLLITGIPMDLMKQEAERADLQAALDRGVLAATSLSQTLDAQAVVADYVRLGAKDGNGTAVVVSPTGAVNDRRIEASASYAMNSIFLGMIGYKQLGVGARSAAAQGISGGSAATEISLVLDISGTMRYTDRLPNLQVAASDFVDQITAFGANNLATINIVPYAGQVNPGPYVFSELGGARDHAFSSCFEFTAGDFLGAGLPSAGTYAQVPNFHHWAIDRDWMDWGWCPGDDTAITYVSSANEELKDKIDSIRLHDGTGTYNGMKWGLALLDPTSQPLVDKLIVRGDVDPAHAGRPYAWNAARKYIVLMTDGQITEQNRPTNPTDPRLETEEVLPYGHPTGTTLSRADGLTHFYTLCNEAKSHGVTVFTIAFEAPEGAKAEMQACASSPSHFFEVEGLEIKDAFQEIATSIQKLKLVL